MVNNNFVFFVPTLCSSWLMDFIPKIQCYRISHQYFCNFGSFK